LGQNAPAQPLAVQLILQRLAHLNQRIPRVLKQTGVLDRDRRLVRKGYKETQIRLVKILFSPLFVKDHQCAQDLVIDG
jgi:hypothetical protein